LNFFSKIDNSSDIICGVFIKMLGKLLFCGYFYVRISF